MALGLIRIRGYDLPVGSAKSKSTIDPWLLDPIGTFEPSNLRLVYFFEPHRALDLGDLCFCFVACRDMPNSWSFVDQAELQICS